MDPFKANLPPSGKRFSVPGIMQIERTECGAACLLMIFSYYKNWIPLEIIRSECGINRHGSNAAKVLATARKYGFLTKGIRAEVSDLKNYPFPMIVFWNQSHFVVLEGIIGEKYYINDPATGPETLPKAVFQKFFSNVCLLIQPGPDFRPNKQLPPSEFKHLMNYISQNKADFSFICLITILLAIPGLCFPLMIKIFIDDVLTMEQSDHFTMWFFSTTLLIFAFSMGLFWLQQLVIARFEMKLAVNISKKLLTHVLTLPLKYFSQRFPGDIATRIYSVKMLSSLISGPASSIIGIFLIIVYGIAMTFYSPSMSLVTFVFVLVLLAIFFNVFKKRANNTQKLENESGQFIGITVADLKAIETIQLNGNTLSFFERCNGWQTRTINSFQKEHIYNMITGALPLLASTFTSILVLGYGGWLYNERALSLGELLAFQALAINFMAPFSTFIALGGMLSSAKAHFTRINDVLNHPQDELCPFKPERQPNTRAPAHLPSGKLSGHIEIQNITFGYDLHAPPIFKNFSLSIRPQEQIALLGQSGCGKSTLAELICGLQAPWSGKILFDGEDLHNIPSEMVAQSVSYVRQNIVLFNGTVRDNLSMWNPFISGEDMIAALKDACIHDEIHARPEGLDSRVVNSGENFSWGERQRLEIARALCNNPSILILDEATSALDPIVEMKIEDNLRKRNCTCIIVAHRLSTLRGADELILLERGKIAERGNHDQLKREGILYNQLLSSSSE